MSKLDLHTICRILEIDAGHRVVGHEGKCASLHGHRYKFEIYATADDLDNIGRVIDFSILKEVIGNWLEHNWDHAMILWEEDPVAYLWQSDALSDQKFFALPYNPTAENLASYLFEEAEKLLKPYGVRVIKIVCWETPNCFAIVEQ